MNPVCPAVKLAVDGLVVFVDNPATWELSPALAIKLATEVAMETGPGVDVVDSAANDAEAAAVLRSTLPAVEVGSATNDAEAGLVVFVVAPTVREVVCALKFAAANDVVITVERTVVVCCALNVAAEAEV